jgi:Spy/CpxP family protein refolding chaperone
MTNKPILLTLALAAVSAAPFTTRAEDEKPAVPTGEPTGRRPGAGGMDVAERLKTMKEKLGLTEEQTGKIKEIFEKHRDEFATLRKDESLKPEEKRAKLVELRKAEMGEVRALLTPEQQEKLKELRPAGRPGAERKPEAK